ncbi:MAG: helix-turn-helix transcriptional regulator [Planctomycetes bacterium]|nr:helix-turn-helix transcriptional regulator [Planctomycetota bacterium]
MSRKFSDLKAKMSPEARTRAETQTREMMAEMLLSEVRRLLGLTQEELAEKLGIKQPTLSRLESQDDMYVSTLRRLIEALGGRMEIVAHLPNGDIRIEQFHESVKN